MGSPRSRTRKAKELWEEKVAHPWVHCQIFLSECPSLASLGTSPLLPKLSWVYVARTCHVQTHLAISLPAKSSSHFCVPILFDLSGALNTVNRPSFRKLLLASLTLLLPGASPTSPATLASLSQSPDLDLSLLLCGHTPRDTS